METTSRWYYTNEANQPIGPLSLDDMRRLAEAGIIAPTTYVIEEGTTQWIAFSDIPSTPLPASPKTSPASVVLASEKPSRAIFLKAPPRWLAVLFLIIFFPIGLVLLWVSNFKKPTKIIVTAIFAMLFFVGLFSDKHPPNESHSFTESPRQDTSASQDRTPTTGSTAPLEGDGTTEFFQLSLEDFKRSYNRELNSMGLTRYHIDNIAISKGSGAESDAFTVEMAKTLALVGPIDRPTGRIGSLWLMATDITEDQATQNDILFVSGLLVGAIDPAIEEKTRGPLAFQLCKNALAKRNVKQVVYIRNLRISALFNDADMLSFFISPKNSPMN